MRHFNTGKTKMKKLPGYYLLLTSNINLKKICTIFFKFVTYRHY